MASSRAIEIIKSYDNGMADMSSLHSLVRICARYFKPTYQDLTTDPTDSEVALPNTSAGILAQIGFVAGIYSNTISMGRGELDSADASLRDMELVKRFYGKVGEKANDIVKLTFPQAYRVMLDDLALSSVGIFYVHFDEDMNEHEVIPWSPADCVWFEDANGRANKMFRGFEYTADQAVEEFGYDSVSPIIQKAWGKESEANKKFKFIHCCRARKKRDPNRKDSKNMPYESLYVEVGAKKVVKESGLKRFRYVVTVMMKRRGLRTGYSSAMHSLPSMRTLVRGTDDFMDAIEFKANPVMFMSDRESVDNAKSLSPGDVRYAKLDDTPFIYGDGGDPSGVDVLNDKMREEIKQLHFIDLFQALEQYKQGTMTAYQVSQILAEKIHLIAPIIHPIKETFSTLFEIIAEDIMENGLVDMEIPPEVAGSEFRVKYTSRIDSRTSGVETENLMFALQEMAQVEELMQGSGTQSLMIKEKILRYLSDVRSVKTDLTRDTQGYKDEMNRLAQEAQAAMAQQANAQAASKRDLNKAPEEGSEASVIAGAKAQINL